MNTQESILSTNLLYNENKARWDFLYRSFIGGDEYRKGNYLTRYSLETDKEYEARIKETPYDNQCQSVINIYNSFLFRTEPEREFNSIENLPELQDFLKDADFDGRSLNAVMREVSQWSQVYGHCWVVMSKPNVNATTRADEVALGVRPYLSLLTPQSVLDWAWERSPAGRYTLSYLKYIEDINGDITVVREWTQSEIVTTHYDRTNEKVKDATIETNQLGVIPAVISYSNRSMVRGIGCSVIDSIADLSRYIYNSLTEAAQSIRLSSHPSLIVTPDVQVGTGSGAIIQIPDNLEPGLKPYTLDFNGASIDSIYKVINNTIETIEKSANIGSVRTTEAKSISGVSREMEFQLLNSRLSQMADNIELTEEQLWRLFCLYQGQPFDVEIKYPDSFSIKENSNELQQLKIAADTVLDPRVRAAIDAKVLDLLELDEDEVTAMANPELVDLESVPEEDEFKETLMINPLTAEVELVQTPERQLALAKQGWVRKD